MIIKFPTGLYRDVLPKNPEDKGSVTYIISNTEPPRTNLIFPKLPTNLAYRKRNVKEISVEDRRKNLGDLVFSVSGAKRKETGNNSRQYELGQLLEFGDSQFATVQPMLVGETTETRHDTNMLDYESLGVSAEEQAVIAAASTRTQATLTNRLNDLKRLRADAEVVVNAQQKIINEANRTISALEIVATAGGDNDVKALVDKLKARRTAAFTVRDKAIADADRYATEAEAVASELRSVALVVR